MNSLRILSKSNKIVQLIGMCLFLLLLVSISYASQELQYSSNSSKYGSWFQDIQYNINYNKLDILAEIRKEKIGDIYNANCHYSFVSNNDIDYFAFVAANNDEIMDDKWLRIGIGGGKYFYRTESQKHKFSIAAITYNGRYSTSIRFKSCLSLDKLELKNIYNYIPESTDINNDFTADYKVDKKISIGYKYSFVATEKTNNYRDSLYVKYNF